MSDQDLVCPILIGLVMDKTAQSPLPHFVLLLP